MIHAMAIRWALAVLACTLLIVGAPDRAAQAAEKRLALVIGNEAYPAQPGQLSLPHEDADAVAGALRQVGFQVTLERDLGRNAFGAALSRFEQALAREAAGGAEVTAFFYFSGHGASALSGGRRVNMLIPSGAAVATQGDLLREGIGLDAVIDGLAAAGATSSFVVVDACRNELNAAFTKGPDKGFGVVAARNGLIIAQATFPGETAPDDGVFAQALARHLVTPGQYASRVFELAYRDVQATRPSYQLPTVAGALTRDFCFNGCPGTSGGAPVAAPAQSPRVVGAPAMQQPAKAYPLALELVYGEGMQALGKENFRAAHKSFDQACSEGHADACNQLGHMVYYGKGLWSMDKAGGTQLLDRACSLGSAEGCLRMGYSWGNYYGFGATLERDHERAFPYLETACALGSLEGCFVTGQRLLDEVGVALDTERGRDLWDDSCNGGFARACYELGDLTAKISGQSAFSKDYYRQACALGYDSGCQKANR